MATLREQLNQLFPEVLSKDPSTALNGTELLEKVRSRLADEYSDGSIRQHFSVMSQDATSSIAKVTTGQGYYLRSPENRVELGTPTPSEAPTGQDLIGSREELEEKFRSIFIRHSEQLNPNQKFAMCIEHRRATRRDAGVNQWKFPDVVLLAWQVGKLTDQGYKLDPDLLAVKTSLGEPPFSLESIELKVEISLSTFRENFFQCVSNSKWAHGALLAVANNISDNTLSDELRRLGASYDVSVVSYGLSSELLERLPSASDIRKMPDAEFECIASKMSPTRISTGKERATLDWEHINDLHSLSPDFRLLFQWIAHCLSQKRAYNFSNFRQIQTIEQTTA